jgi:protein-tyrosine phosphatase
MKSITPSNPTRSLGLLGASNFRDLGGYVALNGQRVRWRTVFRSDHLAGLSGQDAKLIQQLGISRSLDFRGASERSATSYHLPGVIQHSLAIEPTVVQGIRSLLDAGKPVDVPQAIVLMCDTYRNFITANSQRYREFFSHLLEQATPLVFHCTAGKDRTGFAASLFLQALGVPRAIAMQDFLLTNQLYKRPALPAESELAEQVLEVIWSVKASFLEAAHELIDRQYGGIDTYLEELGVDGAAREKLAKLYLDPA